MYPAAAVTVMDDIIDLEGIDPAHHGPVRALAQQMIENGMRREDPVRSTFALLGDRWSTLILLVLGMGKWRHAELQRVLGRLGSETHIAQRVLTLKLRTLERDGIVARHVIETVPPQVSYSLTPFGSDLLVKAQNLIDWVNDRADIVQEARAAYDRNAAES